MNQTKKKLLITGATGYIGSWLVRFFSDNNYHIIAHGSSEQTISQLKQKLQQQHYSLDAIDFWQQNFMEEWWTFPNFQELEYIIHCAALTSVRKGVYENYNAYFDVNVEGTKRIAKKALELGITHFIHLSSGQIYGNPEIFPIDDHTLKEPINLYGFTKLMSEEVIKSLGTFGLNHTIIRPFSVYGKEQSNIISIILNKIKSEEPLTIFGDGTQKRAFMHIDDICNAIHLVLGNEVCFGEEYNLSGPKEYSVNLLVKMISKKFQKEPHIIYKGSRVNELQRNLADTSKLKRLGFHYTHSLENFIDLLPTF
ncbi:MAG: putative UDP-glucose 4-epimerase [Promethearchaeota archaeon]|nr:MAG: putative UDP-glucose 4-epimerase [Candidatus Lokiarchaeota archaeon]